MEQVVQQGPSGPSLGTSLLAKLSEAQARLQASPLWLGGKHAQGHLSLQRVAPGPSVPVHLGI